MPAIRLRKLLYGTLAELQRTKTNDPLDLARVFSVDAKLKHLWDEYSETLHTQTSFEGGISRVAAVRSTQPSDSYFNSQFVIDSRIGSEFFKHLPGILTGLGIIGTFSGLIGGLRGFQTGIEESEARLTNPSAISSDSSSVNPMQEGLKDLLGEVSVAFVVSASAILFAMVVTFLEKWLLADLYRLTEEIAQDIDARFDAGAGEEYLARLVHASEESASQAKILKDSLVNDLRDILREIAERQIQAGTQSNVELGATISRTIAEGLAVPLDKISNTVATASGDQSAVAGRLLQDAMASFSQQVSDLFGGQLKGIAQLNTGAAANMTEVVQTLNRLVSGIEAASTRSVETVNEQLANAIQRMEQHQQQANVQSAAFVEHLRSILAESQTESAAKMQAALSTLGENVSAMLDSMRQGNERLLASSYDREETFATRLSSSVGTMTGSVETAIQQLAAVAESIKSSMAELSRVSTSAIDRMNQGANVLHTATIGFAEAGKSVTGVVNQVSTVGNKFAEMSGALTSSASAMSTTVSDYQNQRQAVVALVAELKSATEIAKRDLAMSQDVVSRIEASTQKLTHAQGQVSEYLNGVGDVLVEAQGKFSDATVKTLDRVNQDFHKKLEQAISLLSGSIQELEVTFAQVGAKR
ncbi:MAG: anti-phage ZorAB system protein ZorA [Gemmatimonas sp.]